jgi:hypothetical protein
MKAKADATMYEMLNLLREAAAQNARDATSVAERHYWRLTASMFATAMKRKTIHMIECYIEFADDWIGMATDERVAEWVV